MKKKLLSCFVIVVVVLGVSFGAFAAGEQEAITLPYEPSTTEAFDTCYWSPGTYSNLVFSSLLYLDEDLIPSEGDLAEKWDVSSDETTYTFYLRKGLTFHDGEPLTTEDVAWSLKTGLRMGRILNGIKRSLESIEGAKDYAEGNADDVSGIKIIDETTIQLTVEEPNANFLNGLNAAFILPMHLLEDEDPATIHQSDFFMKPVGSGPYKIVQREPGDFTILEAFDNYYAGKPNIDKVVFRYFENMVPAFEAGDLDFVFTMYFDQAMALMDVPSVEVTPVGFAYLRFMAIKVDTAPFDDVKVRKALYHAIDRKALAEQFFQGYAVPIDTNMYPGFWVNKDLVPYDYNPEKAKALLQEAGWDSSRKIDMIFYYNDQQTRDLMSAIQYYWDQVGVKLEARLVTGDVTGIIHNVRNYDIWYGATGCSNPTDHLGRWMTHYSSGTGHANARYDELLELGMKTLDPEKRKVHFDEMQKILHDDVVVIPLYSPMLFFIQNPRIERPEVFAHGKDWHVNYQWEKWKIKE